MNVHFGLPAKPLPPGWITIGTYDGIHRGHRRVLERVVRGAAGTAPTSLLTFDPHPRCVLAPDACPLTLTTVDEKAALLGEMGIDNLVVLPFNRKLSELTATDFMDRLLARVPLQGLVIGYDFALGHQRRGNREFLERYGDLHGFQVEVVDQYSLEGQVVSSTVIRTLLLEGNVAHAAKLLGRQYSISSFVEHGTGTGSRIGYPTANFAITPNKLVPHTGVYAVWVDIAGREYQGAMNVGYRPTFGENRLTVEAFILDFDGDIYHQDVRARFVQRIRDEKRFDSVDALVAQIAHDVERARAILRRG
ncbi:MAG: riboflavin kinase / adenylyltransferase [Chloroflexota bacterium]|jgi:riboflavin kinase/FMN adenylyltransferase|nr:riboflavin kinase / adenylyltransferase [Chloroflexota bacterium]